MSVRAVEVPSSAAAKLSLALAVAMPMPIAPALAATLPDGLAAGAGIQRCEAADGTVIYTDTVCALFDARPAPLPADLLTRIALANAPGAPGEVFPTAYRDAAAPWPSPGVIGRRSPSGGCARTPRQLSRDLIGSFALRDVNRVAESYHWVGLSHRQSMPVMRQLERLAAQPLADARFLAAWIGPADAAPGPGADVSGLMQLVFAGGDTKVIDLEVRRHSGCYFISF